MTEKLIKVGDKMFFAVEYLRQIVEEADGERTLLCEVVDIKDDYRDDAKVIWMKRVSE